MIQHVSASLCFATSSVEYFLRAPAMLRANYRAISSRAVNDAHARKETEIATSAVSPFSIVFWEATSTIGRASNCVQVLTRSLHQALVFAQKDAPKMQIMASKINPANFDFLFFVCSRAVMSRIVYGRKGASAAVHSADMAWDSLVAASAPKIPPRYVGCRWPLRTTHSSSSPLRTIASQDEPKPAQQTYSNKLVEPKPPLPKSQSDVSRPSAPQQSGFGNTTDDEDDDFLPVKPKSVQRARTDGALPPPNVSDPPKPKPSAPKSLAAGTASSTSVFDFDDTRGTDTAIAAKRPKISITFASRPSKPRPPSSDEEEDNADEDVKGNTPAQSDSDDESTATEPDDLLPPKPINVPLSPLSSRVRTVRSDGSVAFIAQYGKKKSDPAGFSHTKVAIISK